MREIVNKYTPANNRAQQSPEQKKQQIMAEYAVAKFVCADIGRHRFRKWTPDYDVDWRLRLEVKSVDKPYKKLLIWPVEKNDEFDRRWFDCLVLVKTYSVPKLELVGWTFKQLFRLHHKVADGSFPKGLKEGTRHMHEKELEGMPSLLTALKDNIGVS